MVDFLSDEWLEEMTVAAARAAGETGSTTLRIQQIVTGGPGGDRSYVVDIEGNRLSFRPGQAEHCDVRLSQDYATAAALAQGRMTATEAFMQGRVRVGGDLAKVAKGAEALAAATATPTQAAAAPSDVFASVRARTRF